MTFAEELARIKKNIMGDKIYVVEDGADIRKILHKILTSEGYDVVTCVDGLDFREKFMTIGGAALVLSDLMMPNMNGVKVVEMLLKIGVPCIVITAAAHTDDIYIDALCLNVPIIDKPVDKKNLLKEVKKALE